MSKPRRVYSTGPEGVWASRDSAPGGDLGEPSSDLPPERHALRMRLERGGRKGKQVTVVGPLIQRLATARELLGTLKKQCGSGGTLKPVRTGTGEPAFELEIQGDQTDRLGAALAERGFSIKRSGG